MADADDGDGEGNSSLASPDRSFALCKPLAAHVGSAEGLAIGSQTWKDGRIFYGNDLFYVLFRLVYCACTRCFYLSVFKDTVNLAFECSYYVYMMLSLDVASCRSLDLETRSCN